MVNNIIFYNILRDWNSLIYYTCSKLAMHVDGCFKFERYHTLERYNQQNFVLNTVRAIISNATSFYLK